MSGFIPIKNLSDSSVIKPEDRVQRNQSIYCRIVKIHPEKFSIDAICKSSALADNDNEWKPRKDAYYDENMEAKDKKANQDMRLESLDNGRQKLRSLKKMPKSAPG